MSNTSMLKNSLSTPIDTVNLSNPQYLVCGSNSSRWALTAPLCSFNFSSFFAFVFVAVLLSVVTLWTIFGNALVWLALYKFPKLRSVSNCLIGNLALSDMLLATTVLPISTGNDLLGYWVFGETMCPIWLCIDVLYCTASIWGLVTIAIDRYTATVYPVWYFERRSPVRALIYIAFVWLFSIIISIAPFIGWRDMIPGLYKFNQDANRYECVLFDTEGYVVYSAMGSFVIPTILMLFLYVRIFIVLRKRMELMKLKKKKLASAIDRDFESGAIQESNSHLNLHSGGIHMSDKATQISPTCRKQTLSTTNTNLKSSVSHDNVTHYADKIKSNTNVDVVNAKEVHSLLGMNSNKYESEDDHDAGIPLVNGKESPHGSKVSSKDASPTGSVLKRSDVAKLHSYKQSKSSHKKRNSKSKHMAGIKSKYELREQRATKRMAIVMGCYLFCWIPFLFMYLIRSFCASCDLNVHIQASIIWLGYANSGINPILYTLFNEDFRDAFKTILGCDNGQVRRHFK